MKAPIQRGGEVRYFPKPHCLIVFFFFEIESSSGEQDGLELKTPLLQSLGCWDGRCALFSKIQSFYQGEVLYNMPLDFFR